MRRPGYHRMSPKPDYSRRCSDMEEVESATSARYDGRLHAFDSLDGEIRYEPEAPEHIKDERARARYAELYARAYDECVMDYADEFTPELAADYPEGSRVRGVIEGHLTRGGG